MMKVYSVVHACYIITGPSGQVWLYDTSHSTGGRHVVIPFLRYLGITQLSGIILSHYHWDHIGGAARIIRQMDSVGAVYSPGVYSTADGQSISDERDGPAQEALDAAISATGVPYIKTLRRGDVIPDSDFHIRLWGPEASVLPDTTTTFPGGSNNMMVRFSYGDFSIVFTGDETSTSIVGRYNHVPSGELETTVYVAYHHGDPGGAKDEIIEPLNPELVWIEDHTNRQTLMSYLDGKSIPYHSLADMGRALLAGNEDGSWDISLDLPAYVNTSRAFAPLSLGF